MPLREWKQLTRWINMLEKRLKVSKGTTAVICCKSPILYRSSALYIFFLSRTTVEQPSRIHFQTKNKQNKKTFYRSPENTIFCHRYTQNTQYSTYSVCTVKCVHSDSGATDGVSPRPSPAHVSGAPHHGVRSSWSHRITRSWENYKLLLCKNYAFSGFSAFIV